MQVKRLLEPYQRLMSRVLWLRDVFFVLIDDLLSIYEQGVLESVEIWILVIEAFEAGESDCFFELKADRVNSTGPYGPILFKFELTKSIKD